MATKDHINLEMPSILGMGAVGPTLAVLTASMYQALEAAVNVLPTWTYPAIMLVLAGLLAIFPTAKTKYPDWQKLCIWPLAAIVIFSAAWRTNHGLSAGEEVLNGSASLDIPIGFPSLVSSAYAQTTNMPVQLPAGPVTNKVNFVSLDMSTKKAVPKGMFQDLPKHVWGLSWPRKGTAVLKDGDGTWYHYKERKPEKKPSDKPEQRVQEQKPLKGGFFKRF